MSFQYNNNGPMPDFFDILFSSGNFGVKNDEEALANGKSHIDETVCWVFGYGSLCWFPGFEYASCITGYIRGFERRFWQGSVSHRGNSTQPGRVATLIEDKKGITWGCAYKFTGNAALEYLNRRECSLGGYEVVETKFFPRIASTDTNLHGVALNVLLYVATPNNPHWLGKDTKENIAEQIVNSQGTSGYNAEYLLRLAKFLHEEIPDVIDEHLFELERIVLYKIKKRGISLWTVMGTAPEPIRRDSHESRRRPLLFEFTSRIPERKLRCLNI